jgi:hypothetical protein
VENFVQHLAFLKSHYGYEHKSETILPQFCHYQHLTFKQAHSNAPCSHALYLQWSPFEVNPIAKLWCKLSSLVVLMKIMSEYFKVVEMAMVQVLGSI